MRCDECRADVETTLRWYTMGNGARVIRAWCLYCRKFLGEVPQTPEAVAEAWPECLPAAGDLFGEG